MNYLDLPDKERLKIINKALKEMKKSQDELVRKADKLNKTLVEQFNITEPMNHHYVLTVKGVKFTVSKKEIIFFTNVLLKYKDVFERMAKK